jgi:hypothetical protein
MLSDANAPAPDEGAVVGEADGFELSERPHDAARSTTAAHAKDHR